MNSTPPIRPVSWRRRGAWPVFTIALGVAAVVAMLMVGRTVAEQSARQFRRVGTDFFVVTIQDSARLGPLTPERAQEFARSIPAVAAFAPFVFTPPLAVGRSRVNAAIVGAEESFARINRVELAAGRFVHSLDGLRAHCVVGAGVAAELNAAPADLIGRALQVGANHYEIIGVLAPHSSGGAAPYDLNRSIVVPFDKARRLFPAQPATQLIGRFQQEVETARGREQVVAYFARFHRGTKAVATTSDQLIKEMDLQTRVFTLMLGAIGVVALVFGGISVANLQVARAAEVRAHGAASEESDAEADRTRQRMLAEPAALGLAGGALGLLGGVLGAAGLARLAGWQFVIDGPALAIGLALGVLVGFGFGVYPVLLQTRAPAGNELPTSS